jgi:transcriptional regulator with XRE-family HTH domain
VWRPAPPYFSFRTPLKGLPSLFTLVNRPEFASRSTKSLVFGFRTWLWGLHRPSAETLSGVGRHPLPPISVVSESTRCSDIVTELSRNTSTVSISTHYPPEVALARSKIDVSKLYGALDAERNARGISWRQLAAEIGVSPSLLSRLSNDQRPDVDAFMTLVQWLGVSADEFMEDDDDNGTTKREQPELSVEVAALLRSRSDLSDTDRELLQDVFQSALKHVRKISK